MEGVSDRRREPVAERRDGVRNGGHDAEWPCHTFPGGQPSVPAIFLRCRALVGFAGLSRADACKADGGELDGTAAARRSDSGDVSQQEARKFSALSRCRFEYAPSYLVSSHLPGAKGLSEPRDPGSICPLSNNEILRRARPIARNSLHQIVWRSLQVARDLWKSRVHSMFACIPRNRGVQARRELNELRGGHDSTGLRAAP